MKIYPLLTIFLAISLFGLLFFQLFFNSDVEEFNQKSLAPFESKLLNGDSFTSEQLKNDSLSLINVWATWCVGCRLEHSYLMELEKKGIPIIGINYKDSKSNADNFLKNLGNPYDIILIDEDGKLSINWGAYGVPETFLIFNNKIKKKYTGSLDETSVQEIEKIFN